MEGGGHPREDTILRFIKGECRGEEREVVFRHLNQCDECLSIVLQMSGPLSSKGVQERIEQRIEALIEGLDGRERPLPRRGLFSISRDGIFLLLPPRGLGIILAASLVLIVVSISLFMKWYRGDPMEFIGKVATRGKEYTPYFDREISFPETPFSEVYRGSGDLAPMTANISEIRSLRRFLDMGVEGNKTIGLYQLVQGDSKERDASKILFTEYIGEFPEDPDALNYLGIYYLMEERYSDAFDRFEEALSLDPFHREAIYNRSLAEREINLFHKEREDIERFLELEEGTGWAKEMRKRFTKLEDLDKLYRPPFEEGEFEARLKGLLEGGVEEEAVLFAGNHPDRLRDFLNHEKRGFLSGRDSGWSVEELRELSRFLHMATGDGTITEELAFLSTLSQRGLEEVARFYELHDRLHSGEGGTEGGEEELHALAHDIDYPLYRALAHHILGNRDFLIMDFEQALDHYREMEGAADGCRSPIFTGMALSSQGVAMGRLGNFERGEELLLRAGEIYRRYRSERRLGIVFRHLADLYKRFEVDPRKVERYYIDSLDMLLSSGDIEYFTSTLVNFGDYLLEAGRTQLALMVYDEVSSIAKVTGSVLHRVLSITGKGEVYQERGENEKSIVLLKRALNESKGIERPYLNLQILRTLSLAYRGKGDMDGAKGAITRAMEILEKNPSPFESFETLRIAGMVEEGRGDAAGARSLYLEALGATSDLSSPGMGEDFRKDYRSVFDSLMKIDEGDGARTLYYSDLMNSSGGERLEYDDFIRGINRNIWDGEVILEFFKGEEGLAAWTVSKEGMRRIEMGEELLESCERLSSLVRGRGGIEEIMELAERAYSTLLEGAGPVLKGAERLVLVSDPALSHIPLELPFLMNGGVEEGIIHSPSISSIIRSGPGKRAPSMESILIAGNTLHERGSFSGLPLLAYAGDEIKSLSSLFGKRMVLERGEANRNNILRYLPSYDIFHFAGHSIQNLESPLSSFLLLSSQMRGEGLLTVKEILEQDLKGVGLVVLSSCGMNEGGDAPLIDLCGAFLTAGANFCLSSRWRVADRASLKFMEGFYRNLIGGADPPEALMRTKGSFWKGEIERMYTHPHFWAGYFIKGSTINP